MWKTPRTLVVASVALVAGLGVVAAAAPAMAAQDPVLTQEQATKLQAEVDAYKACLEQQGVTLPDKPADGPRTQPTDEQRRQLRAAREACAASRPSRPELSDAQKAELQSQMQEYRQCMDTQLGAAGITKPQKPADGSPPNRSADAQRPPRPQMTDEQKAAVEQARTACADLQPNLGVDGLGPMGQGPMGQGPGGQGPGGQGPGGQGPGGPGGQAPQPGSTSGSAPAAATAV